MATRPGGAARGRGRRRTLEGRSASEAGEREPRFADAEEAEVGSASGLVVVSTASREGIGSPPSSEAPAPADSGPVAVTGSRAGGPTVPEGPTSRRRPSATSRVAAAQTDRRRESDDGNRRRGKRKAEWSGTPMRRPHLRFGKRRRRGRNPFGHVDGPLHERPLRACPPWKEAIHFGGHLRSGKADP